MKKKSGYTCSKNPARNRLKIQFVRLDSSKLFFSKSSTDQQGVKKVIYGLFFCIPGFPYQCKCLKHNFSGIWNWLLSLLDNIVSFVNLSFNFRNQVASKQNIHSPCWSVLEFWKIKLEKSSLTNWIFSLQKSISKFIFAGYTGSKNQVRNRLKIQFFELDFSKLIIQISSTDQQGENLKPLPN